MSVSENNSNPKKKKESVENSCLKCERKLLLFVNVIVPLRMSDSSLFSRHPRLDTVFYDQRCESAKEAKH